MFIITLDCYAPSFCFLKIKQTEHIYDNRYICILMLEIWNFLNWCKQI